MNQNYLKKYLDIKVFENKTIVTYCNDNNVCFIHEFKIGLKQIEENSLSTFIFSDWISNIIYVLQNISLTDRVPTYIYLTTEKYQNLFAKFLKDKNTYSQFFIKNEDMYNGIHVIIKKINHLNIRTFLNNISNDEDKNIIEDKLKLYERYTNTTSKFKI